MIERGSSGVYTGGKGVLVRSLFDTLDDGPNIGVPATFWSNDIFSVSQMYPDRVDLEKPTVTNIFDYATVGFVIGSSLSNFFYDYDNLQGTSWGWGVFYAHDANSVDLRCRWLDSDGIYDCPGGYIPWGEDWISDSSKLGTGGYPVGNPYANSAWGGGAGCHMDINEHVIDQLNQLDSTGQNLVQDDSCQCNYYFNSDWSQWVSLFAQNKDYSHIDFHADQGICWVSNIQDMINMQNWLFWMWVSGEWKATQGTFSGDNPRDYMGWNEIPLTRTSAMDPSNWDSFIIKLPANLCGNGGGDDSLNCLGDTALSRLEIVIARYTLRGYLLTGADNAGTRPGSYTVVVREWQDVSGNWFRWFFCENWDGAPTFAGRNFGVRIPVERTSVMDPGNWDSFVIKLPANLCGDGGGDDSIKCLGTKMKKRLESLIGNYVGGGFLLSGEDNAARRPGSYAVVAREWQDTSGNWFRWFFCENW
eukprot:CAMPEP_0194552346 /NCGR_PEP_ID=MMETSP0253-20130528/96677_1 /TAXON_ID=2966 /ORGANISM="Noctiluca scintillans" /LENGTH=473 /DNA_ID=CAMNT_0039399813 /DNA_START=65 /DNA_END=1483 /DNA_ORIENTATION=+